MPSLQTGSAYEWKSRKLLVRMRTLWRMDRNLCRCRARFTDWGLLGICAPSSMPRKTPRGDTGILTCPSALPPAYMDNRQEQISGTQASQYIRLDRPADTQHRMWLSSLHTIGRARRACGTTCSLHLCDACGICTLGGDARERWESSRDAAAGGGAKRVSRVRAQLLRQVARGCAVQVHSRGAQCVGAGVGVQSCLLRQGAHALPVLCLHITSDLNRQFCFGVVSVGLNGRNSRDPVTCACPRLLKQALP